MNLNIWVRSPCFLQLNTYRELVKIGFKVTMICEDNISYYRKSQCGWSEHPDLQGVNLIVLRRKSWRKQAREILLNSRESIHIFGSLLPHKPFKVAYARRIALKMKMKIGILTEPSRNDKKSLLFKFFRDVQLKALRTYVKKQIACKVGFVLAVSSSNDRFFRWIGLPEEKLFPFGYFPKQQVSYADTRDLYTEDRNLFRILFVGSFTKIRNIPTLINSFVYLKDKNIPFVCYMIGEGTEKTKIVNLTRKLRVADNVVFLGPMKNEEERSLMKSVDVVVVPTYAASLGIPILEAIHEGIPSLVSSGDRGASEIVRLAKSGFVFERGKSKELASLLITLASEEDEYEVLKQNALSFSPRITPERAAKYLADIIAYVYGEVESRPAAPWI